MSADCWSPVCVTGSKPSPRSGHTLTALDEKRVLLVGGHDGKKYLNDVWLFDAEKRVLQCSCDVSARCYDFNWCVGVVSYLGPLLCGLTQCHCTLYVQWYVIVKRSRCY